MAILKSKEISKMTAVEREEKLKELRVELVKSGVGKKSKISPKEIRKAIARVLTEANKKIKKEVEK